MNLQQSRKLIWRRDRSAQISEVRKYRATPKFGGLMVGQELRNNHGLAILGDSVERGLRGD